MATMYMSSYIFSDSTLLSKKDQIVNTSYHLSQFLKYFLFVKRQKIPKTVCPLPKYKISTKIIEAKPNIMNPEKNI